MIPLYACILLVVVIAAFKLITWIGSKKQHKQKTQHFYTMKWDQSLPSDCSFIFVPINIFYSKSLVPPGVNGQEVCGNLSRIVRKLTNQSYLSVDEWVVYRRNTRLSPEPLRIAHPGKCVIWALSSPVCIEHYSLQENAILIPPDDMEHLDILGDYFAILSLRQKYVRRI
uniref:Uncharacterized protein n=1 Tax=viral metagenome TaxID=1070528 RepID=A0A6C0BND9_9ZZZZ